MSTASLPQPSIPAPPEPKERRTGVLLVNLGTPQSTDTASVRRYLREFLSDKRVVDYPRALWLPLLHGVILNTRPARSARAYAKIWRRESNESPLRYFTRAQAERLRMAVGGQEAGGLMIDWAMRYGSPSISERMAGLTRAGCARIIIVALYPQYSATTTASVNDEAFRTLMAMVHQPALRTVPAFYDHPAYIEALANVSARHLESLDFTPERVLISFHGLPSRHVQNGDPYHHHCTTTATLLRREMGWSEEFSPLTFQSKFGPEKWLGPATNATLVKLAGEGVKKLAVITPGFVSDCIETLEEIAIAAREQFVGAGGTDFSAIPCLNDSPEMIDLLSQLVMREIAGWDD